MPSVSGVSCPVSPYTISAKPGLFHLEMQAIQHHCVRCTVVLKDIEGIKKGEREGKRKNVGKEGGRAEKERGKKLLLVQTIS